MTLASLGRRRTAIAGARPSRRRPASSPRLGGPYRGATALLLAACATVLLPLLPVELARISLRLAAAPALAVGSFTILVTTVSTLGIPLTEISIRAAVAVFVVSLAVAGAVLRRPDSLGRPSGNREAAAVAAVLALAAFSLASAWDVVGPFPPRGTDWGHYFLYADEVERQQSLLIDDPLAGPHSQVFADPVMVGALYGSVLVLDGSLSRSLGAGAAVASAFSTTSVVAAAGGLWGIGAGLAAGALYAVAPIRMDPMYWHGLATALASSSFRSSSRSRAHVRRTSRSADDRSPRLRPCLGHRGAQHDGSRRRGRGGDGVLLDGVRPAISRTEAGEGFPARWR